GGDPAELLDLVRDSGHPAADEITAWLSEPDPTANVVTTITIIPPGQAQNGQAQNGQALNGQALSGPSPEWRPPGQAGVYQLKISLRNVGEPPVWRRVLVPADLTLAELHDVIQLAIGWDCSHMHVFSTRLGEYGTPDRELNFADERGAQLTEVLPKKRSKLLYTYDFGDDWEHDVVVEDKRPVTPGDTLPLCIEGEGACPPEDCGGPWGYDHLKEILADSGDEEHDDMLDWLGLDEPGEFDAAEFSVGEVNARLGPRA
ncbi:MAG: plasmid pRiA4b ORF-3 family protein, partial [Streptosporangiaceae bacterium]